MKTYHAEYTIATHDTADHYTSATGACAHPCPVIAAHLARERAIQSFDRMCREDDTGLSGSGCLILSDGGMHVYLDGVEDLTVYWTLDGPEVTERHRDAALVESILKRKATAVA